MMFSPLGGLIGNAVPGLALSAGATASAMGVLTMGLLLSTLVIVVASWRSAS